MPLDNPFSLPNLPQLYFRQASASEKLQCWKRIFPEWRGRLESLQDWITFESKSGSTDLTKDGAKKYWILSSSETGLDVSDWISEDTIMESIYSACESIELDALVKAADSEEVKKVRAFGIASVFTSSVHERKGLASAMLRRLAEWLDSQHEEGFSVLYSDIGKEYYSRFGWAPHPSLEINIPVRADSAEVPDHTLITAGPDLKTLCDKDVDQVYRYFDWIRSLTGGDHYLATILPTYKQLTFEFTASKVYGKHLFGREPEIFGAKVSEGTWGVWMYNFNTYTMNFLRIVTPPRSKGEDETTKRPDVVRELTNLFLVAESEAKKWGFKSVRVWSPDDEILEAVRSVDAWKNVETQSRDSRLPHLRWAGDTTVQGEKAAHTRWVFNEHYSWC